MAQNTLTPAMEDYLEAIFTLSEEKPNVRVKDIAGRLGVKMPTVTSMLKILNKQGFIDYEKYEYIELTAKGRGAGEEIQQRHRVIRRFLIDVLKVDSDKADEEACKMEHGISGDTLDRLIKFMEFVQSCPRTGSNWLSHFNEFREQGRRSDRCLERMEAFSDDLRNQLDMIEGKGKKGK